MATLDVTEERRRAIDRVNRAYADEDYDRYERLIERYCHRFGFDGDYSLFEDACTDARIFGHFGKRGLVLQHGEDDVSSFTLNPSWLSCEDETQRCIMVEIYLEP